MSGSICRPWLHAVLVIALVPAGALADDWFDSHIHYNRDQAETLSTARIVEILHSNDITKAAVTGMPPELAQALYRQAPGLVVPLLGAYTRPEDKNRWMHDPQLPARLTDQLDEHSWAGIGELHLFAEHRHNEVFRQIIRLAGERQLPVLIHSDPAVIDAIYDMAPGQIIVWAHAGRYPYTDLLSDYLDRYPALHIDLSIRDERIAPDGQISDDWYELIVSHPDRFMVGVDTYSSARWQAFSRTTARMRHWVSQLPADVADRLTSANASRIYRIRAPK